MSRPETDPEIRNAVESILIERLMAIDPEATEQDVVYTAEDIADDIFREIARIIRGKMRDAMNAEKGAE